MTKNFNTLSCRIYLEANCSREELAHLMSKVLPNEEIEPVPTCLLIKSAVGEIELRSNEEWNASTRGEFPDGFLSFRYVLELYPSLGVSREVEENYVSSLMNFFWSHGFPAVASCDYEDRLPYCGGYSDASLPWPSGTPELEKARLFPKGGKRIEDPAPFSPYPQP